MAHLSRHELKHQDEFTLAVSRAKEFFATHGREIRTGLLLGVLVVGTVTGFRYYERGQEDEANLALGQALRVFHGFVQPANTAALTNPNAPNLPPELTFDSNEEMYEEALQEFSDVFAEFPKRKAGGIARAYMGLSQGQLGRHDEAVRTLEESARNPDPEISALAKFSLAGAYVRAGKAVEAQKIYQELLDHPVVGLSPSMVRMALADSYRSTRPEEARKIYQELRAQFAYDPSLTAALSSLSESLPE